MHFIILVCISLKRQSQQVSSALSSACDFKSHFCKQCGPRSSEPRSDCSFRSSLIWVHTVCRYAKNRFEKFARIFSRRHKQTTFSDAVFLGALRVKQGYRYFSFIQQLFVSLINAVLSFQQWWWWIKYIKSNHLLMLSSVFINDNGWSGTYNPIKTQNP